MNQPDYSAHAQRESAPSTDQVVTGTAPAQFRIWLAAALALAIVGLVSGGMLTYVTERRHVQQTAEQELITIAGFKADQISDWLHERLGDASVLLQRPTIVRVLADYMVAHTDTDAEILRTQFQILCDRYGYSDVLVVGGEGEIHLRLNGTADALHEEARPALLEALQTGAPTLTEIHSGPDGSPHLGIVAPFIEGSGTASGAYGAIVLWSDVEDFLYPLIQSWPTPSETAETLLVRRDGDDVVFLNDLRFHEDAALNLRIPLEQGDLPAAMAIMGHEGLVEGTDYRGVPVVAVLTHIPETGWYMVAKVDRAEVFAPWRMQASLIGAVTISMLLAAGAVAAYVWQRRSRRQIAAINMLLEQRVRERTAELEESNKELEAFAYSVSHDLRSPLRAIDGFSRIVVEEYGTKLDQEGNRLLGVVRRNAQQMDQLISDLLEMSRVGRTRMSISRVDMEQLARSVYDEVAVGETGETFSLELKRMPAAYGDPTMLRLLLLNLIGNAVKFTKGCDTRRIETGGYTDGNRNVYYVKDTGVGFDPRYSDRLFRSFERLHNTDEFPGTGIGLAVVARVARRHGGTVWAESEPGKGATFYVSLPAKGVSR